MIIIWHDCKKALSSGSNPCYIINLQKNFYIG
jgi:hypothetical protein